MTDRDRFSDDYDPEPDYDRPTRAEAEAELHGEEEEVRPCPATRGQRHCCYREGHDLSVFPHRFTPVDPEVPEELMERLRNMPQHVVDQTEAAAHHVEFNVHKIVDKGQMRWSSPANKNKAAAVIEKTRAALILGTARMCPHVKSGPQPLSVLIAAPEAIMCGRCGIAVVERIAGTPEDRTCDFCRREFDLLWPISFTYGPYVYTGGACDDCWPQLPSYDGETQRS